MGTWNITTQRQGVVVKHIDRSGIAFECGTREPGTPLEQILAWVASEMNVGDTATVNNKLVLQRFSASVE